MSSEVSRGSFSFESHSFDRASINFDRFKPGDRLEVEFDPSGVYYEAKGQYVLHFVFTAIDSSSSDRSVVVDVSCNAHFSFENAPLYEDLPDYFFPNSIAIVYPYVRAFVSSLTLLANVAPIVLPTLNLSTLESVLRQNTDVIKS